MIFPSRLFLPHPDDKIPSGYEEDVLSIRDGKTAWVKADPASVLGRPLVNVNSANPAFREAPDKKHSPANEGYRFDTDVPNRMTEQKRLSIFKWNPGPRRGKEEAIEKHIAEKWHIVTLQESIEYLDHDYLTNRFCVTHYGGCAILFNKDTFNSQIKVTSVYLHDTRDGQQQIVREGQSGWVLQAVISRASFRRLPAQQQIILHNENVTHQQPV